MGSDLGFLIFAVVFALALLTLLEADSDDDDLE